MPGDNTSIRVARPAIIVGGRDDDTLAQGLLNLILVEDTRGLYRCEALFGNWGAREAQVDFLYFDRRKLDFGKVFQVKMDDATLFDGHITALEANFPAGGQPQLRVLAEDRFQDLRMTRRTRTFADMTDSDVIQRIAGEHGLTPDVNVPGPSHKVLAQVNLSDLAFLRERARANDAEVWIEGRALRAISHTSRAASPLQLRYGNELQAFTVIADLAHQRTGVYVSGWDVSSKAGLTHEATDQVLSGELGDDQSGAAILQAAFGQRKETLVHKVPISADEARAEAEATFKQLARRFVVGHGVAEADHRLRAGSRVALAGLGPLFDGKYALSEVRHVFDGARGLRAEFTAERPGIGRNA